MRNGKLIFALLTAILLGTACTAYADLVTVERDSADFNYRYTGAELTNHLDWSDNVTSGESVEGDLLRYSPAGGFYDWLQSANLVDGTGWTMEFEYRITDAPTASSIPLGITMCDGTYGEYNQLYFRAGSVRYNGTYTNGVFTDEFHTVRIAEPADGGTGDTHVWVDDLLVDNTTSGADYDIQRLIVGKIAGSVAEGEMLVKSLRVDTTGAYAPPAPPEVHAITFDDVANTPGATTINFDQYVSNPQPGGSEVNGGAVASFAGTFDGFISPSADNTTVSPLPEAVGVLVSDSTGTVEFEDWRSGYALSEIVGGRTGGAERSVTFTFMDPEGSGQKAAVSRVAFAFASTVADSITADFFDPWGNQLVPTPADVAIVPPAGPSPDFFSTAGYMALDDGIEMSLIHKVVFTSPGNDLWLFGSFGRGEYDMAYANLLVVPEPSGIVLLVLGIALLLWRRRR